MSYGKHAICDQKNLAIKTRPTVLLKVCIKLHSVTSRDNLFHEEVHHQSQSNFDLSKFVKVTQTDYIPLDVFAKMADLHG